MGFGGCRGCGRRAREIVEMTRRSVIAAACAVTFLVTHRVPTKQPWGSSYTSTLCFHRPSSLAPKKPGRSCLSA